MTSIDSNITFFQGKKIRKERRLEGNPFTANKFTEKKMLASFELRDVAREKDTGP